jgi:ribosomal protein S18
MTAWNARTYTTGLNSLSDDDWQKVLEQNQKAAGRMTQLGGTQGSSAWRSTGGISSDGTISPSSTSSSTGSFFDSKNMGNLLDTAKQFGDYGFGLQSKGWELANKYRMSEAGQQIEGQKDLANIGQSGETNRLGMSISGEQRIEDTRQTGLTTRQQSQLAEQQRAQLAAFQNQTQQKAQDAARARLAFTGRL